MKTSIAAGFVALGCAWAPPAVAFKLQAWDVGVEMPSLPGADRQTQAFLQQFRVDVHERITQRAYEAAGVRMPSGVIAGIRWNDNPPSLQVNPLFGGCLGRQMGMAEGMECWAGVLRVDRLALESLTQREKSLVPVRSHFGDLQFLHAMAGRAGESAVETRGNILRWSEFAWRVARGEIAPRTRLSGLGEAKSLDPDTGQWIGNLFRSPGKRHWTVADMFLARSASVRQMAFGSLLHLLEDSYSAAHVRRRSNRTQPNGCPSYAAGDPIVQFHTYVGQDAEKHGVCDDAPDWLEASRPGSPIEVLAEIVRAYEEGRDWTVVRAILEEKVLRLADPLEPASPGACFEWRLDEGSAPTNVACAPSPT